MAYLAMVNIALGGFCVALALEALEKKAYFDSLMALLIAFLNFYLGSI